MSLTCTQKVEGKSADLNLSFILFSRILYTNSGSFGKCVVYSPLLYVVLHKRNIIITTTDSTPNVSTNCHATTTSRVWLTNTMSFFLNQSVESEQEQKYVLSNPQNFPGRHYVIDWFSKVKCLSKHRCFPQLPFEQVWPLRAKATIWVGLDESTKRYAIASRLHCARFKQKQRLGCTQSKAEVCNLLRHWWGRVYTSALNCVHPSRCFCLNRAQMKNEYLF